MKKTVIFSIALLIFAFEGSSQTFRSTEKNVASPVSNASVKENNSSQKYVYKVLDLSISKEGRLEAKSNKDEISSIKEKLNAVASKEEKEELMRNYEQATSGKVFSLEESLQEMGRKGYQLSASIPYTTAEGNMVKLIFMKPIGPDPVSK